MISFVNGARRKIFLNGEVSKRENACTSLD
jgi:hypothetical protein